MEISITILTLFSFTALTNAVIPDCATACIAAAVTAVTTCSHTDLVCQCANLTVIENSALTCVLAACADPIAVLKAAQADCAALGTKKRSARVRGVARRNGN